MSGYREPPDRGLLASEGLADAVAREAQTLLELCDAEAGLGRAESAREAEWRTLSACDAAVARLEALDRVAEVGPRLLRARERARASRRRVTELDQSVAMARAELEAARGALEAATAARVAAQHLR